jgi:hypothetical protein
VQPPLAGGFVAGGLVAAAGALVFAAGLLAGENEQAATTKMSSRLPAISWKRFEFIPVNSFDYFDPPVSLQTRAYLLSIRNLLQPACYKNKFLSVLVRIGCCSDKISEQHYIPAIHTWLSILDTMET